MVAFANSLMTGFDRQGVLVVICGPTAVGKTAVSLELANHLKCPIISFDSRQFYKELKIGNARPSDEELNQAEHHFIASRSIHEVYAAGMYEVDALETLKSIFKMHTHCIAVGGSGLYIDALCRGIDDIPSDEELRQQLRQRLELEGLEVLRKEVKKFDPVFYAEGDMQNPHRVMRAIEAYHLSGKPYSELRTKSAKERPFRTLWIGLNVERDELFERINSRVDQMMEGGLVEEARELLKDKELKALKTVGYRELFDYFDEKTDLEEAVRLIKRNSRRYAKQQIGWFKKNPEVHWFRPEEVENMISMMDQNFIK